MPTKNISPVLKKSAKGRNTLPIQKTVEEKKSCFVWETEKNQKGKKELYHHHYPTGHFVSSEKEKKLQWPFLIFQRMFYILQLPHTKPKKRKPRFLKKRKTFEMCLWQVEGCSYSKAKLCGFLKKCVCDPPFSADMRRERKLSTRRVKERIGRESLYLIWILLRLNFSLIFSDEKNAYMERWLYERKREIYRRKKYQSDHHLSSCKKTLIDILTYPSMGDQ